MPFNVENCVEYLFEREGFLSKVQALINENQQELDKKNEKYIELFNEKKANTIATFSNKSNITLTFEYVKNKFGWCRNGVKGFCDSLDIDITSQISLLELLQKIDYKTYYQYSSNLQKLGIVF